MSYTMAINHKFIKEDTNEEITSTQQYDVPFDYDESFWAVLKRWNHYEVFFTSIKEYWYTNILGVRLWTGDSILYEDIKDRLFKRSDENLAIEMCEKLNRHQKVKVHR